MNHACFVVVCVRISAFEASFSMLRDVTIFMSSSNNRILLGQISSLWRPINNFAFCFLPTGCCCFFPPHPEKIRYIYKRRQQNKKQTNKHVECSRCFSCLKLVFRKIIRFSPTFWWRFVTSGSPWDAECWGSPGNLKLEGVSNEPWNETLVV